jgi:hypothetical protein
MNKKFKYTGFGLKILSDMEFPELMPANFETEDITIAIGKIDDVDIPGKTAPQKISPSLRNKFYLDVPEVAKYLTSNGKSILVEPYVTSTEGTIRLFLLSNAMAALLMQRNQILLHSSAIVDQNELILFMGESGAGKSSIAAELSKRGYRIFSDDICVLLPIVKDDKSVHAISSYPMMKLWDDTINALDDDQFEKTHKLRPKADKYGHYFHASFDTNAYPIKKIFILNPTNEVSEYTHRKITGLEAFELVGKNTYRSHFIMENDLQKLHMEIISGLILRAEIIILYRPAENSTIDTFTDYTESLFPFENLPSM